MCIRDSPSSAQSKLSMFSILRSFSLLKGRNGSKAMARLATNCNEMWRMDSFDWAELGHTDLLPAGHQLGTPEPVSYTHLDVYKRQ